MLEFTGLFLDRTNANIPRLASARLAPCTEQDGYVLTNHSCFVRASHARTNIQHVDARIHRFTDALPNGSRTGLGEDEMSSRFLAYPDQ